MKALKKVSALVGVVMGLALFAGCSTTANYSARVRSWEGQDAQSLVSSWGQPDDTEKLSNGNKMFVYARLKHEPVAYNGIRQNSNVATTSTRNPSSETYSEIYVKCATYFEVNPKNIIVATQFRGDECTWKD